MNRRKNFKKKIIPILSLILLLGSLTSSFIVLTQYNIPNYEMAFQSYEEKLINIPNQVQ